MSFCYECSDRGYNVCLCTKNKESLFDKFVREVKEFQNTEEWLSLRSTASNKEVRALEQENARLRDALKEIERFQVLTRQDITLPMEIAREALERGE